LRLLLDTHVALWSATQQSRIPFQVREMIADPANDVCVSVVSLWEIAIKSVLNRKGIGEMPVSAARADVIFHELDYRLLSIDAAHALAVEILPPIHGDPFDRLLVAQALTEPLRLITHDAALAAYSDTVILI